MTTLIMATALGAMLLIGAGVMQASAQSALAAKAKPVVVATR